MPAYTKAEKAVLGRLSPADVRASALAGEPIVERLTTAPVNGAPIDGLKIATENGWFAARPSGTENLYKIYAESFRGPEHLARIQEEARGIVAEVLRRGRRSRAPSGMPIGSEPAHSRGIPLGVEGPISQQVSG